MMTPPDMKFKADFYEMSLRVRRHSDHARSSAARANSSCPCRATTRSKPLHLRGHYTYPVDRFEPGQVQATRPQRLLRENPALAAKKILTPQMMHQVWVDFAGYRERKKAQRSSRQRKQRRQRRRSNNNLSPPRATKEKGDGIISVAPLTDLSLFLILIAGRIQPFRPK
jgi:hypothetical protein